MDDLLKKTRRQQEKNIQNNQRLEKKNNSRSHENWEIFLKNKDLFR
jgi:hypothetical protein